MRTPVAIALVLATTAGSAAADEGFGARKRVVIGAERLFGVTRSEFRQGVYGQPTVDATQSTTRVTVLGGSATPYYAFPRVGVDVFVAKGLSLGLSGGLWVVDDLADGTKPGYVPRVRYRGLRYVIAPRVGFAYPLTSSLAIWGRVGATYLKYREEVVGRSPLSSTDSRSTLRDELLAVTIEPVLVWKVLPPAAVTLAGTLDLGVWGRRDVEPHVGVETPYWVRAKATEYGASVGILIEL